MGAKPLGERDVQATGGESDEGVRFAAPGTGVDYLALDEAG